MAEILLLATAITAHLRSQFHHIFALLQKFLWHVLKALIFTKRDLKLS